MVGVDRFELSTSWSQIRLLPSQKAPPSPISYLTVARPYHFMPARATFANRVG